MKICRFVIILILFLGVLLTTQLFADEDSLSFATYYPAPYGYYNEMRVQKMAVGTVNTTSVPTEDGQLFVDRSVIFKPQPNLNAIKNLANPQKGELAYAASEDKFYYNNNSGGVNNGWVPQAGGGGCYVDYSLPTPSLVGSSCAVDGFTVKGSAGKWGACYHGTTGEVVGDSRFMPPGGGCDFKPSGWDPSGWNPFYTGEAYVCCQ